MRITTLRLKNFRSHVDTTLELDRFNFVRGSNGCGKSSVQMALEYLFTGRCELTDRAGRGAESLIRAGETELAVSATLASGEAMTRRRTRRSQMIEINGARVPAHAAESFLARQLGRAEILSAALHVDRFVEMTETEQRRFLAELVDTGKIRIPDEIRQALRALDEGTPRLESMAGLEAASKRFRDLRAETQHALEILGQRETARGASALPGVQAARERADAARRQPERPSFGLSDAETCWRNAGNLPRHEDAEFDESFLEIPSLWEEDELLRLDSPAEQAKELRRQVAELTAERAAVDGSLEALEGLREQCPTCGQAVSEAAQARETERLRKRLAELEERIQSAREELGCYEGPETAVSDRGSHDRALTDPALAREVHPSTERKLQARQEESRVSTHPEKTHEGQRAPQPEAALDGREASAGQESALRKKLGLLERLIEFFGPNGAAAQETGKRMEQFRQGLNQQLAIFGFGCSWTLEPFEVRVSPAHGPALLFRQLSESERFRFGIAFQIALAAATGIRFLVIDRADRLDKPGRKLLTALLLSSEIEQAIVLATGEEPAPETLPAGVKFLDLPGNSKAPQEGACAPRPADRASISSSGRD